ncbi:MAG TPA: hypothetical protein VF662_01025 [Allosphingosinicella sp.]
MPTTYYLSTGSTTGTRGTFNKAIAKAGAGNAAGQISLGANQNVHFYWPAGEPGVGAAGTYTVKVPVSSGSGQVDLRRMSSADVPQATVNIGTINGAGNHVFTVNNPQLGTWVAGDRLALRISSCTIVLAAGDGVNQQVIAPWSAAASSPYTMAADPGPYALAGAAATLLEAEVMPAAAGAYALSGHAANLQNSATLAQPGTYVLAGTAPANPPLTLENVNDAIAAALVGGANITVAANDAADTVTISTNALNPEQVLDRVAASLVAGSGISVAHNDAADTITISATDSRLTAEDVRDIIGAALVAGSGMALDVSDAGDTITISATNPGLTAEDVRDTMSAALVAGPGVAISPNDAADTITVSAPFDHEAARDTIAAALVAGPGVTIAPNDQGDTITISAPGGGGQQPAATVGVFTNVNTLTIPTGTNVIYTEGYNVAGRGGAKYVFDAAIDATFVAANPRWAVLSANGRGFRLAREQRIDFSMFGAVPDYNFPSGTGTDNHAAWLHMRAFLHAHARTPANNAYYKAVPPVFFDPGTYYFSDVIDCTDAAYSFVSAPSGEFAGAWFVFHQNAPAGIIVQGWDTQGVSEQKGNTPSGGSDSYFQDIRLLASGGSIGGAPGWKVRGRATFVRCAAHQWGGHGFDVVADAASSNGNANSAVFESCAASGNGKSGIRFAGGDVNAIRNNGFQAFFNREFGICDESFLGIDHTQFQLDGNAYANWGGRWGGPAWSPPHSGSVCSFNGSRYRVVPGQHAAASTTMPGTNGGVWKRLGPGGEDGVYQKWETGATYVTGGAFYCGGQNYNQNNNSRSTFQGYSEPNQPSGWMNSETSIVMPGNSGSDHGGAQLYPRQNSLQSPCIGANVGSGSGRTYKFLLGNRFTYTTGQHEAIIAQLGSDNQDGSAWDMVCDSGNTIRYRYFGLEVSPMTMIAQSPFQPAGRTTNHEYVMQFGRGCYIGDQVFLGASNGPPADHDDTAFGSIFFNRLPEAGEPWGWQKLTDGTWRALMP